MKFKPHNYQIQAMNYILTHKACALFLDCGLGKTVITLSALVIRKKRGKLKKRSVLIVAPRRPAESTWPNEINKWDHTKGNLTYAVCKGTPKKRAKILQSDVDIIIISRDLITWLVDYYGADWPFETVVLDELSSFKSAQSARTKALVKVRNLMTYVIGLTGTPASNGYMDLWAEYRIIDNGQRLGERIGPFREMYFKPLGKNGYVVYSWYISQYNKERINQKISDITLSQRACDFLDMPDLINLADEVQLDPNEMEAYKEFAETAVLDLGPGENEEDPLEITAANGGVLAMKLTQYASGSIYDDEKNTIYVHNKKYEKLEELIEAQNGKPCLVAYWFNSDHEKLKTFLSTLKIDGRKITWGEIETKEDEDRWNRGEWDVALIHPAKSGHGLNLQEGSNALIWFSLPWSLELYQQTVDRLYRQGQTEDKVLIHHILVEGTIDVRIYNVLIKKDKTQSDLLNAVKCYVKEDLAA